MPTGLGVLDLNLILTLPGCSESPPLEWGEGSDRVAGVWGLRLALGWADIEGEKLSSYKAGPGPRMPLLLEG